MGNTRTVIDKIELEKEQNGDQVYAAIKQFLIEGLEPDPDILADVELKIKVQRVSRSGQTQYGVALTANTFDNLVDRILEECGPGSYNIFVEYKKVDGTKWKLAKGNNLKFVDPEQMDGGPMVYDSPRGDEQPKSSEAMELVKALITANTQMVTAALAGKNNNPPQQGSNIKELIEAVRSLDELRGPIDDGPEEEPAVNPDDPYGLLQMASPVIAEILKKMVEAKTPEDGLQAQEELRKTIAAHQPPPGQLPS